MAAVASGSSETRLTAEEFFARFEPPVEHAAKMARVRAWLAEVKSSGRPVVLVTSGGTTVPLEKNTVRFIDNFSGGNRGSASAEYFLQQGYSVLFVYRKNSLKPFSRHLQLATDLADFLNYLEETPATDPALPPAVCVKSSVAAQVRQLLKVHNDTAASRCLHCESFQSIYDYLWLFHHCIAELHPFERRALVYCAAAVSDFFLLPSSMSEHKIQSSGGGLTLTLDPVPKCLAIARQVWAPAAFFVSFKLETDPAMLAPKVARAFAAGQQVVVGNLLATYKQTVSVFTGPTFRPDSAPTVITKPADGELEAALIAHLGALHHAYLLG
jgi:phosphopantothenate-cysteine ligase